MEPAWVLYVKSLITEDYFETYGEAPPKEAVDTAFEANRSAWEAHIYAPSLMCQLVGHKK